MLQCPLDYTTVTICRCGQCFILFHSALLGGDRTARGRSLFERRRKGVLANFANSAHSVRYRAFQCVAEVVRPVPEDQAACAETR